MKGPSVAVPSAWFLVHQDLLSIADPDLHQNRLRSAARFFQMALALCK